jgi:hypothetical protein
VAADAGGNFVVVWQSTENGLGIGVFGQRYDSAGAPLGAQFVTTLNVYTMVGQLQPSVASDSAGNFVVFWQSGFAEDGSGFGVFGQRYDSMGASLGALFQVNTYTTSDQRFPSLASDSGGNLVVAWQSFTQDGSAHGIFGRRFGIGGASLGTEFQVNTFTLSEQIFPSVAADSGGDFVVVWQSVFRDGPGSGVGVIGQSYTSTGAPLGTEFLVNSYTTNDQRFPSVASGSSGRFVVVWQSYTQDDSLYGVFGQRFCPVLSSVTISVSGTTTVCTTSTGGTATVTDVGGGSRTHQWGYRTTSLGSATPIIGQTGTSYPINGADFGVPPGTPGFYYLVCVTIPECGSPTFSNEIFVIVGSDTTAPAVTPPSALMTTQTLCM